jgi:hypothetical protein
MIGFSPSTITTICGVCISSTSTSIPPRGIRKLCSNARYRNVAASSALRPLGGHYGWFAAIFKTRLDSINKSNIPARSGAFSAFQTLSTFFNYAESCCERGDLATRSSLYCLLPISPSGSQPYPHETRGTDSQLIEAQTIGIPVPRFPVKSCQVKLRASTALKDFDMHASVHRLVQYCWMPPLCVRL